MRSSFQQRGVTYEMKASLQQVFEILGENPRAIVKAIVKASGLTGFDIQLMWSIADKKMKISVKKGMKPKIPKALNVRFKGKRFVIDDFLVEEDFKNWSIC